MANNKIVIQTPRGVITSRKTRGGNVISKLEWSSDFAQKHKGRFDRKQAFVDQECIRHMAKYTPRRSGALIKTATLGTVIGSGEIHQIAPYARRQYYEHATKAQWFEEMKMLHRESILKGAQQIE